MSAQKFRDLLYEDLKSLLVLHRKKAVAKSAEIFDLFFKLKEFNTYLEEKEKR